MYYNMDERKLLKEKTLFYLKKHKFRIILLYIATATSNLVNLIPMYLFGHSIDYTIAGDFKKVLNTIILIILIFLFTSILSIIETVLHTYINQDIVIHFKSEIYDKILYLKKKEFDKICNGEILSKIERDTVCLAEFITEDLINLFISIVTLIVSLYLIIRLSPTLTTISLIIFPITVLLSKILSNKLRKYILKGKLLGDNYFSITQETLSAIEEIKSLGMERLYKNKYKEILSDIRENEGKKTIISTIINFISSIISSSGEWLILLVASWMIINKTLSVGTLIAFNSFNSRVTLSISQISKLIVKTQNIFVSLKRIEELTNLPDENQYKTKFCPELSGNIEIVDLSFSYYSKLGILKNINLDIKNNDFYVIVGRNGCGKTTLLNIVSNFLDDYKGEILFDNYNVRDIDIDWLRKKISYIPQQPHIFQGTIDFNLSLSNENLSESYKIEACKLVGLHSFIDTLPNKYNTILGKDGVILSGGQKQKLAIARAILRNPKIMILDEITSDLDSKSEVEIMSLLNQLKRKYTIITVAHRISSILYCPNIIVMDNGEIVGMGDHEKLITECDSYIDLYRNQLNKISEKLNNNVV
ncbi:ABC transporter ATP-binding protein [Clostridium sporogenes]|uniref:peptidase domain-containing ABC transporter n=2 Tax=Clostridium sporogenes TaxID=1509 RepID=UPI000717660A|nr:ABC transporter ATP-binding protein [Clostridium sporogenes]MDU1322195.1 ABC transporter ATP-binding protein [Clostridium botulinum]MBY7013848.1 ABC transporter ATP-binding protein [Clostridium sporogenes]NFR35144.1 ABC transporter ATP-binding protein [Clostridium sporogenes]NFR54680.1 ABC transporter ATP-binding protein [Clostridium sporogenes]OQP94612.1 ABC transporter ATP-binding protein [Clostridium sporogenes]